MHDELISEILKEEEEVLNQHREHIDSMYKSSKSVGGTVDHRRSE